MWPPPNKPDKLVGKSHQFTGKKRSVSIFWGVNGLPKVEGQVQITEQISMELAREPKPNNAKVWAFSLVENIITEVRVSRIWEK